MNTVKTTPITTAIMMMVSLGRKGNQQINNFRRQYILGEYVRETEHFWHMECHRSIFNIDKNEFRKVQKSTTPYIYDESRHYSELYAYSIKHCLPEVLVLTAPTVQTPVFDQQSDAIV